MRDAFFGVDFAGGNASIETSGHGVAFAVEAFLEEDETPGEEGEGDDQDENHDDPLLEREEVSVGREMRGGVEETYVVTCPPGLIAFLVIV